MHSNIKSILVLATLIILVGGMSFGSVAVANNNYDDEEECQEGYPCEDLTPTPTESSCQEGYPCETPTPTPTETPSVTPTESPTPTPTETVTPTPTSTPSATPTPTESPRGGPGPSEAPKQEILAANTFAETGNPILNIALGLGLSLLTFGGVATYVKRNIS